MFYIWVCIMIVIIFVGRFIFWIFHIYVLEFFFFFLPSWISFFLCVECIFGSFSQWFCYF
jgi:hypothetical protein